MSICNFTDESFAKDFICGTPTLYMMMCTPSSKNTRLPKIVKCLGFVKCENKILKNIYSNPLTIMCLVVPIVRDTV